MRHADASADPTRRRAAALAAVLAASLVASSPARAIGALRLQTVFPSTPGQNQVRWWEFDWRFSDFAPVEGGAPVRLYFYESETNIARLVKPLIADAYREYAEAFAYRPTHRIPFLLYNSHFEFESTTAFFISEGVLGVTSTEDLTMALPYWGERARFDHVMRHELAHQFAIQKVRDESVRAGCDPSRALPLWFQEGLAEFFSLRRLGPDVQAALADRVLGGKKKPVGIPGFFDEGLPNFERVYLIGHAQVEFLEQTFGAGTTVRVLETAPQICATWSRFETSASPFVTLLQNVTGASEKEIQSRWHDWVEAQVAPVREARQSLAALEVLEDLGRGEVDSFSVSPDGRTLLYRILDPDTGISSLYLRDVADKRSRTFVADDRHPAVESLHPLDRRVTALGADRLVYIGRRGPTDRIFIRTWKREERGGRVRFALGRTVVHDLTDFDGLIEAGFPALDPQTGALVFSALSRESGFLDIYRMDRPLAKKPGLTQLTHDAYAETALAFSPSGTLVFASDATGDARNELFRFGPQGSTALTAFPDPNFAQAPAPGPEESWVFESDAGDRLQSYALGSQGVRRLTDVPTLFASPGYGADGALLGVALVDGHRTLARIPRAQWIDQPVEAVATGPTTPWPVPRAQLEDVTTYNPLALRNYSLAAVQAVIGSGPIILGQLAFTDLFKGRLAGIDALVLGGLDRSDLRAFYFDQSGRWTVGGAAFFQTTPQFSLAPDGGLVEDFRLQRAGAELQAAYPFGRYTRFEGYVSPQLLRASRFSTTAPGIRAGSWPALRVGAAYVLDTLRQAPFGPVAGTTFSLGGETTFAFGGPLPFGTGQIEFQTFKPLLLRLTDRVFASLRLAAAASIGQRFAEQFYVPAAYNLRALPDDSVRQLGSYYYLGQLELHFPLAPALFQFLYLQGIAGVDAGAVFFSLDQALRQRVAAGVLGFDVGFGPITLRFQWARPFDIGAGLAADRWLFHFSIIAPGLLPF